MDSQKYAPVRLRTLVKVKKVSCLSVYRICVQTHDFMSDSDILSLPKVTYIVLQIPHLNSQFGWKTNFPLLRQFSQKNYVFVSSLWEVESSWSNWTCFNVFKLVQPSGWVFSVAGSFPRKLAIIGFGKILFSWVVETQRSLEAVFFCDITRWVMPSG